MTKFRFDAAAGVTMPDSFPVGEVYSVVHSGARLDRLPLTRYHRRLLWIIGLSIFFDFFDAAMAGVVVGGLLSSHWSTLSTNTLFLSAAGVGGVIGNLVVGKFADKYGRRPALRNSLLLV